MNPERWKQIADLLEATLELPEEQRTTFLRQACGDDQLLQEEVASLMSARRNAGSFLEKPAIDAAGLTFANSMTAAEVPAGGLQAGQAISHYRIEEKIAAAAWESFTRPKTLACIVPSRSNFYPKKSSMINRRQAGFNAKLAPLPP